NIWQAEEVLRNGKWERFYGIVCSHDLAMVPAEEIEFELPGETPWEPLSHQSSCALISPPVDYKQPRGVTHIKVGEPVPIVVALGNRRGLPQSFPAIWFQHDKNDRPVLRPGVSMNLTYSSKANMSDGTIYESGPADKSWATLPAKPSGIWRDD